MILAPAFGSHQAVPQKMVAVLSRLLAKACLISTVGILVAQDWIFIRTPMISGASPGMIHDKPLFEAAHWDLTCRGRVARLSPQLRIPAQPCIISSRGIIASRPANAFLYPKRADKQEPFHIHIQYQALTPSEVQTGGFSGAGKLSVGGLARLA